MAQRGTRAANAAAAAAPPALPAPAQPGLAAAGGAAAGVPPLAPAAAAAAPVGPPNRPTVMPEAFDGEGDWEEYLLYFEQCAVLNGWNDPLKTQFLGVRLRGAAQRYYATLPNANRFNWQLLVGDMTRRFAPAVQVRQLKAQFKSRRRGSGESLAKYADELRRLVSRAYPGMTPANQDELPPRPVY